MTSLSNLWKLIVGPLLIPVALAFAIQAIVGVALGVPFDMVLWAALGSCVLSRSGPDFVGCREASMLDSLKPWSMRQSTLSLILLFFRDVWSLEVSEPENDVSLSTRWSDRV